MSSNFAQRLSDVDNSFHEGRLSELEYKELKWGILQELCQEGLALEEDYYSPEVQETTDANGKEFCYVGTGPFVFGPDDDYCELKAPIYISKYPVTVAEFLMFVEDSGHNYSEEDIEQLHLVSPDPDCPVSHVSWVDAKEYCRWLRKVNQEYYSLPHEIEWERAARGIDGRFYPWGNDDPTPELACYRDPVQYEGTTPVMDFPANVSPVGCAGMVGNVWEWCLDTVKDSRDPHILRGGSWCNPVDYSNCISRTFSFPPEKRVDYGGFRIVYLPHDMLVEYRHQYAGGIATNTKLTVVTHAKRKAKMLEERPEWTGENQPAAAAAVTVKPKSKSKSKPVSPAETMNIPAGGADSDLELNELMAEAISEAADIYRRSLQGKDLLSTDSPAGSKTAPVPMAKLGDDDDEGGKKVMAVPKPRGRETSDGKRIPFSPDDRIGGKTARTRTSSSEMTGTSAALLGLWIVLLIGVAGLMATKLLSL